MKTPTTLTILALVIASVAHSAPQPNEQQVQAARQAIESLALAKTRPLSVEQFTQIIQTQARTNLDALSESQRKKLIDCLARFYACYSTGDFTEFKRFRLHAPFLLDKRLASAVTNAAAEKGTILKSDEDILRFAWKRWNGDNKIGQVSEEHVILSCVERADLGKDLHLSSLTRYLGNGAGAACWGESVIYQPTAAELLKKYGTLRFFSLELLVRFSPLESGPASPLVLVGYWDPTREDWMPDALCTPFHVGGYDTIF